MLGCWFFFRNRVNRLKQQQSSSASCRSLWKRAWILYLKYKGTGPGSLIYLYKLFLLSVRNNQDLKISGAGLAQRVEQAPTCHMAEQPGSSTTRCPLPHVFPLLSLPLLFCRFFTDLSNKAEKGQKKNLKISSLITSVANLKSCFESAVVLFISGPQKSFYLHEFELSKKLVKLVK